MPTDSLDAILDFVIQRRDLALSANELALTTRLVIDAVGCQLGGMSASAVAASDFVVGGRVNDERCSGDAAFVDGVALRDLDFLDVYVGQDVCHPAENIPWARVLAERCRLSGAGFLATVATAYEAQCRLADAVDVRVAGLHHTTMANITIPVMAGVTGSVDPRHVGHAISLALARGVVLRSISQGDVSEAKAMAFPLTARGALTCVELASRGVTGPRAVLDDLLRLVGADPSGVVASFRDGVTSSPRLDTVALKSYPVQYALQGVAEAGIAIHERLGGTGGRIRVLEVKAGNRVNNATDAAKRAPQNRETADHSLYAVLAIAIAEGRVGIAELREEAWRRPQAARLASILSVSPAPEAGGDPPRLPDAFHVEVTLTLDDGTQMSVVSPRVPGGPSRPLSDEAIQGKFATLGTPTLGTDRTARLHDYLVGIANETQIVGLGRRLNANLPH